MEKEALLKVILNNINDVETLVKTFNGSSPINPAFLKLTLQKIETIKQEIELLETVNIPVPKTADMMVSISSDISKTSKDIEEEVLKKSEQAEVVELSTNVEQPNAEAEVNNEVITIDEPSVTIEEEEPIELVAEKIDYEIVGEPESAAVKSTPAENKPKSTIGDSIAKDKTSVGDKIGSHRDSENVAVIGKPVDDIKKAFGINDRFLYQRELFKNSASAMSQTLDELNQLNSYSDALDFLKSNFNWDSESETVTAFLKTVKRKFIS